MAIPEATIRSIMDDYQKTRETHAQELSQREAEIYEKFPRIRAIDEVLSATGLRLLNAFKAGSGAAQNANSANASSAQSTASAIAEEKVAAIKAENEKISAEKAEILKSAGYPADYLELTYTCPDCKDTGFIGQKRCHCLQKALMTQAYRSSNIASLLARQNFQTFDLNRFSDQIPAGESESPRQNAQKTQQVVMDFIWNFGRYPGAGLLFYGAPGTGKTFFLSCIAKEMMDHGFSVYYISAYDLCDILSARRFADKYSEEEMKGIQARYKMIEDADLLLIDDLGTEFSTQLSVADLFHCINSRINDGKSAVISTNMTPNQLAKNYTERFASRVCGEYKLIRMFGEDMRLH